MQLLDPLPRNVDPAPSNADLILPNVDPVPPNVDPSLKIKAFHSLLFYKIT